MGQVSKSLSEGRLRRKARGADGSWGTDTQNWGFPYRFMFKTSVLFPSLLLPLIRRDP